MSRRRGVILTLTLSLVALFVIDVNPAAAVAHSCTSIEPADVIRGENGQLIHLNGNYPTPTPAETVTISPPDGITIVSTSKVSTSLIDIVLDVAPNAPTTPRKINVNQVNSVQCAGDLRVGPVMGANPILTSIAPAAGEGGTTVEITDLKGNDFAGTPTVVLERTGHDPIPMDDVTRVSTTKVTGSFDLTDVAPGRWSVRLTNPDGGSAVLPNAFNVVLPAPTITEVTPSNVAQTATGVKFTVEGTGFATGFRLTLPDADGATVTEIERLSSTLIEAKISVASNAPLGSRDVLVTNADGQSGACSACFFVVDGPQSEVLSNFNAYGTFDKGGYVSAGEIDGDPDNGAEIVTGVNQGGSPHVQLFRINPDTGKQTEVFGFHGYDSRFIGGVRVAVGELDGDNGNGSEIVLGPGPGGGPHVRVVKVNDDLSVTEPIGGGFMAFTEFFTGGVYVAAADLTGDGRDEVIVGAGPGGGPHVRIMSYNPATGGWIELAGFYAYGSVFSGGVVVAGGDVVPEDTAPVKLEAIVAPASGGGPHVRLYDQTGTVVREFMAFETSYTDGVRIAAGDLDFDTVDDVIVARAEGSQVAFFTDEPERGFTLMVDPPPSIYGPNFTFGTNVASFDMDGDGDDDLVTAPDRDSQVIVRVTRVL